MSTFLIVFKEKKKYLKAVNSAKEYLELRNQPRNVMNTCRAREGDVGAKMRLVQFCYNCVAKDGTALKDARLYGNSFFMDYDDEETRELFIGKCLEHSKEVGLLMLERSVHGAHAVFRRKKGMTILENQYWVSRMLGCEFDNQVKDLQRVTFSTTGGSNDLIMWEPELFDNTYNEEEAEMEAELLEKRIRWNKENVPEEVKKRSKHVAVSVPRKAESVSKKVWGSEQGGETHNMSNNKKGGTMRAKEAEREGQERAAEGEFAGQSDAQKVTQRETRTDSQLEKRVSKEAIREDKGDARMEERVHQKEEETVVREGNLNAQEAEKEEKDSEWKGNPEQERTYENKAGIRLNGETPQQNGSIRMNLEKEIEAGRKQNEDAGTREMNEIVSEQKGVSVQEVVAQMNLEREIGAARARNLTEKEESGREKETEICPKLKGISDLRKEIFDENDSNRKDISDYRNEDSEKFESIQTGNSEENDEPGGRERGERNELEARNSDYWNKISEENKSNRKDISDYRNENSAENESSQTQISNYRNKKSAEIESCQAGISNYKNDNSADFDSNQTTNSDYRNDLSAELESSRTENSEQNPESKNEKEDEISSHQTGISEKEREGNSGEKEMQSMAKVMELPYEKILPAVFKEVNEEFPNVMEGCRNTTIYDVSRKFLRFITDFNTEKIMELIYPDFCFGLEEMEVRRTVESAVNSDRTLVPKRLKEIIKSCMMMGKSVENGVDLETGRTTFPYPNLSECKANDAMMPAIPKFLQIGLKPAPEGCKFIAFANLCPALGTLMTDVRCQYGDDDPMPLNGWSHLDGPPASGKSMIGKINLEFLAGLIEQDTINEKIKNDAKARNRSKANGKGKMELIPELPKRILPPDTTRNAHIEQMDWAKGKHTYTLAPELSSLKMRGNNPAYMRDDFELHMFDNALVGKITQMENQPSLEAKCMWNVTSSSTRDQTYTHWTNMTDGAITRVLFSLMPDSRFLKRPRHNRYSDEDKAYIRRATNLMMKLGGYMETPMMNEALDSWSDDMAEYCEEMNDEGRDVLRRRSTVIAHTVGAEYNLCLFVQQIMNEEDAYEEKRMKLVEEITEATAGEKRDHKRELELREELTRLDEEIKEWEVMKTDLNRCEERAEAVSMALFVADYCVETQDRLWGEKLRNQIRKNYLDSSYRPSMKLSDYEFSLLPDEFIIPDIVEKFPGKTREALEKMINRHVKGERLRKVGTKNHYAIYRKINED